MSVTFDFREYLSSIFGKIKRPVAEVLLKNSKDNLWYPLTMLVDTGADYTLLPPSSAVTLGINLSKDCNLINTQGVGGTSRVYFLKRKIEAKIGNYHRNIPIGFTNNNSIPPLLGRQRFLETFKVTFEKFKVTFK